MQKQRQKQVKDKHGVLAPSRTKRLVKCLVCQTRYDDNLHRKCPSCSKQIK